MPDLQLSRPNNSELVISCGAVDLATYVFTPPATGFFWRGPRSWTGCDILGPDGAGAEATMGMSAPWIALTGQHDELDGGATIVALAGTSSSSVPLNWFVRSEPFAALAPSPAFHEEFPLAPGGFLRLRHRYVFVDRICGRSDIERIAKGASL